MLRKLCCPPSYGLLAAGSSRVMALGTTTTTSTIISRSMGSLIPTKELLKVVLIGRPNTGKSTLFNRLTGRKSAIVSPVPGTTRDRKHGLGMLGGMKFELVDTGGYDNRGAISTDIKTQIAHALKWSHVALFMLDSQVGTTPVDAQYVRWLRKSYLDTYIASPEDVENGKTIEYNALFPKDVIVLANKTEGGSFHNADSRVINTVSDATRWGLGEPIPISATHGDGMTDLFQALYMIAKKRGFETGDNDDITFGAAGASASVSPLGSGRTRKEKKLKQQQAAAIAATTQTTSIEGDVIGADVNLNVNNNGVNDTVNNTQAKVKGTGATSSSSSSSSFQSSGAELTVLPGPADSDAGTKLKLNRAGFAAPITLEERVIQLAIMGKPNVGKSTLFNAICREERVIVGPTAGLTRDSIAAEWAFRGRKFRLVDTAGLTRILPHRQRLSADDKKNVSRIEAMLKDTVALPGIRALSREADPSQFSCQISEAALVSALHSLRFSQVVLLVIEGDQGKFSKIDLQLAEKCKKEGRAMVIVANKADLVAEKAGVSAADYAKGVRKHTDHYMKEFGHIPIVTTCALRSHGMGKLLTTVIRTHDAWSARISTWVLNRWLADLMVVARPPRVSGKIVKIKYITQIKSRPPVFALFCNVDKLPSFFERFLRFKLQSEFRLEGIHVRFAIRKTETRAVNRKRKEAASLSAEDLNRGTVYARNVSAAEAAADAAAELELSSLPEYTIPGDDGEGEINWFDTDGDGNSDADDSVVNRDYGEISLDAEGESYPGDDDESESKKDDVVDQSTVSR